MPSSAGWLDNTAINDRASDFDEGSADVPIWGWLSGASGRRDAARNQAQQQRQERAWQNVLGTTPSEESLTTQYQQLGTADEYGDLAGGPSAVSQRGAGEADQQRIMGALRSLQQSGGYTGADRTARSANHAAVGQQLGSANEAALQSMYARGMGGSGSELAARLSGAQGAASANAQGDAQIQQAAMQRALQAMQAQGGLAGQMNDQQLQRQQALNDYNQQQLNWRRGRSAANTELENRTRQSRSQANQQAYENRERGVAGLTGQYQQGQQNRRADAQREDQQNQNAAGWIGALLAAL